MSVESYRYRSSAEFAWALKMDQHADQDWTMLRREFPGGEEYVIVNSYPGSTNVTVFGAGFGTWFAQGFRIRDAHRGSDR